MTQARKILTSRQYVLMRDLWREGLTMKEIASRVGCSMGVVRYETNANRDDFPRRNHKVTTEDEIAMLVMWASGASLTRISNEIGCNRQTVKRRLVEHGVM